MCESDSNWLVNVPLQTSIGQAFDTNGYVQALESKANV